MVYWKQMFVNSVKFEAILLDKQKSDYTGTKLTVSSEEIQVLSSLDVLSVPIYDELNFNLHINRICKSSLCIQKAKKFFWDPKKKML